MIPFLLDNPTAIFTKKRKWHEPPIFDGVSHHSNNEAEVMFSINGNYLLRLEPAYKIGLLTIYPIRNKTFRKLWYYVRPEISGLVHYSDWNKGINYMQQLVIPKYTDSYDFNNLIGYGYFYLLRHRDINE